MAAHWALPLKNTLLFLSPDLFSQHKVPMLTMTYETPHRTPTAKAIAAFLLDKNSIVQQRLCKFLISRVMKGNGSKLVAVKTADTDIRACPVCNSRAAAPEHRLSPKASL